MTQVVIFLLAIASILSASGAEELRLSDAFPTRGEATTITVLAENGEPAAELLVKATYSPNASASITATDTVGVTDEHGQVVWTPHTEGIVMLQAVKTEGSIQGMPQETVVVKKNVSVKFANIPPSGVFIFLFAGSILFGGIVFAYRKLVT